MLQDSGAVVPCRHSSSQSLRILVPNILPLHSHRSAINIPFRHNPLYHGMLSLLDLLLGCLLTAKVYDLKPGARSFC